MSRSAGRLTRWLPTHRAGASDHAGATSGLLFVRHAVALAIFQPCRRCCGSAATRWQPTRLILHRQDAVLAQPGWSLICWFQHGLTTLFCSMGGYAFACLFEFRPRATVWRLVMGHHVAAGLQEHDPVVHDHGRAGLDRPAPRACTILARPAPSASSWCGSSLTPFRAELIEAARMDGCGEFGIYWRMAKLPLLRPAPAPGPDHLHRQLEQLHRPADRDAQRRELHAAAGAGAACRPLPTLEWGALMTARPSRPFPDGACS